MIKKYSRVKLYLAFFDFLILLLALTFSFLIRYKSNFFGGEVSFPWMKLSIYFVLLFPFIIIFRLNNLYKHRIFLSSYQQFIQISKSLLFLIAIYVLVFFSLRNSIIEHSRLLLCLFFLLSLFFLSIVRIVIIKIIYKYLKGNSTFRRRIIVIGAGRKGHQFLAKVKDNLKDDIEVIGFFDDDPQKKDLSISGIPVLGTIDDLDFYLKRLRISIDGIYICINSINNGNLMDLINKCEKFGYSIYIDSEKFSVINDLINVHEYECLLSPPIYKASFNLYKNYIKKIIDISSVSIFLLLLSPFFLIISILIKMTSKGPIFFRSTVVGKNEKEFIWYKFRTMKIDQEDSEHFKFMNEMIRNNKNDGIYKIKEDKRITKIGKFLRKFSLDELPQLINVLKGQMSLIGPRPCTAYEYSLYKNWYKKRFSVVPGITGLWQAFGRSKVNYDDMVIMDLYSIENLSFWLDLKILIKTIPTVLFGKGAY